MRKPYYLLIVLFFPLLSYAQRQIRVIKDHYLPQVLFGEQKIWDAAKSRSWQIIDSSNARNIKEKPGLLTIHILVDSAAARMLVDGFKLKPVKSLGDQCYAIRRFDIEEENLIMIAAGEATGAMYGALDIAEAIRCNTIDQLTDSDNTPYLINRGIKFNLPLDLRTPTYSDPGDAHQQNLPDVWDINFWREYFDEMAIHRYNVMTWWSLQPFPSMVKVPGFPETALNDVWRTKEKYDDTYSSKGIDFDRPYLFKNVEIIKKMTIDEKIVYWKKVMQLAADRGIDIYLLHGTCLRMALKANTALPADRIMIRPLHGFVEQSGK